MPTTAVADVQNTDPMPSVTVSGPASPVNEGDQANFQIALSGASSLPVTVFYQTLNATASAGFNFTSVNNSVVIQSGNLTASAPVPTLDGIYEPDDPSFGLEATGVSGGGASLARGFRPRPRSRTSIRCRP